MLRDKRNIIIKLTIDQPVNHTLYFLLHGIRVHNLINDSIDTGFHPGHLLQITHGQLIVNGQVSFKISVNFPAAQHDASIFTCMYFLNWFLSWFLFSVDLQVVLQCQKLQDVPRPWEQQKQQQDRPVQIGGHRLVHSDPQVLVGRLQNLFL